MTRFDAADSAERQLLYADAIRAHRQRASPFLTIEAETDAPDGETDAADGGGDAADGEADAAVGDGETDEADESAPEPAPWVQFSDGVVNLDCTDAELDRLKELLGAFPAFKIAEITRPDEAEGANVRVSAKVDEKRLAEFLERTFRTVYELDADYRAWVVEV